MIPRQLIAPEQLTDPGVNFASVHGLTPVTAHMSFRCPRATSRRGLSVVQHRVTSLAEVTFSMCMIKIFWGEGKGWWMGRRIAVKDARSGWWGSLRDLSKETS